MYVIDSIHPECTHRIKSGESQIVNSLYLIVTLSYASLVHNSSLKRQNKTLLEDLSISPWVFLAVNNNRLNPTPLLVDKFPILWIGVVEFSELVALIVRSDIEGGKSILAPDDEGALYGRV